LADSTKGEDARAAPATPIRVSNSRLDRSFIHCLAIEIRVARTGNGGLSAHNAYGLDKWQSSQCGRARQGPSESGTMGDKLLTRRSRNQTLKKLTRKR
jgi:hypothetical protein